MFQPADLILVLSINNSTIHNKLHTGQKVWSKLIVDSMFIRDLRVAVSGFTSIVSGVCKVGMLWEIVLVVCRRSLHVRGDRRWLVMLILCNEFDLYDWLNAVNMMPADVA